MFDRNGRWIPDAVPQIPQMYQQAYAPYQGYQQPQPQPQPMNQTGINWVEGGLQEANSYPLAPNTAVALWDRHQNSIYIKSADSTGQQSLKILDYTERARNAQEGAKAADVSTASLATKEDVAALAASLRTIEDAVAKIVKGATTNE